MVRVVGVTSNTAPDFSILDELENWEAVLKGEPEVIHKLGQIDAEGDFTGKVEKSTGEHRRGRAALRGPSP